MRANLLVLPVLLLVAAVLGADDKAADKELDKVQGKWTVESLTVAGKNEYADGAPKIVLVFKGNKGDVEAGNVVLEYSKFTISLDPSTDPKCMDLTFGKAGVTFEAIYEVKGDDLRICVHLEPRNRPTEFASPEGSKAALAVAKRQKP